MKKITTEILKQDILTESDIKLLCRRANNEDTRAEVLEALNNEDESYNITVEQSQKGLAWLKNQNQTPRGVTRKNSPFGHRELDAINFFTHFTFDGLYNAGNAHMNYFIPIYTVHGHDNGHVSFQYVLSGGKINIIG
ncbi:MAG: hypothetical protein V4509_04600 [Patescibacteria group bacterium]